MSIGATGGVANAFGNLGNLSQKRGDLAEASACIARRRRSTTLGRRKHASAFGNLGNLSQMRGDLAEAERMYRKALEIDER
jgi:tetratricopeptide (TPR) repeat protein